MAAKAKRLSKEAKQQIDELEGIPVTTTDSIPGYEVVKYVGFVWGTTVQSRFIGHDIMAMIKAMLGGEVWTYTRMMNESRHYVIHRLVQNAKSLGADAVIGVDLDAAQVMPGTIDIFAYGTAVKIRKK